MNQEEINYSDIIDLGFKEEHSEDSVYYNQYGYDYVIITKKLSKYIYIDWAKETRKAEIIRVDKNHDIKAMLPIKDLKQLKTIINFYGK